MKRFLKGKAIKVISVISVVVMLLFGVATIVSRAMFNRSLMASVATVFMKCTKNDASYDDEVARFEKMKTTYEEVYSLPKSVQFDTNWEVRDEAGMQTYYLNLDAKSGKTVFFIHGGGYVSQPNQQHWEFLNKLIKKTDCSVIAPIYPLAPYHTYEEAYERIESLYLEWKKANPDQTVIFMGDSAGGGLALGVTMDLRDGGKELPDKMVLISPWVDISMKNPDIANYEDDDAILAVEPLKAAAHFWMGEAGETNPKVSPIYGKFNSLPDTFIIQGNKDLFYPDVMKFSDMLKENKVNVSLEIGNGLGHVYPIWPIPEANKTIDAIMAFIKTI